MSSARRRRAARFVCSIALAGVAAACLPAGPAQAHTRSLSYSTWQEEPGGARVQVRVTQLDLSRLGLAFAPPGERDPIGDYLQARLRLFAGDEPCEALEPVALEAPEGWAVRSWRYACPVPGPYAVEGRVLLDAAPSHLHFARLRTSEGRIVDRVLSESEPRWEWPAAASGASPAAQDDASGTSLGGYLLLGIEHILTGWDHLAFVAALLLLAGTIGEVAALVTSFTLAHSVTLALATLGYVRPDANAVEALIGFSIALVAAENGWILGGRGRGVPLACAAGLGLLALAPVGAVPAQALLGLALFSLCHFGLLGLSPEPARLRVAVAFAFGLVHGFGFAGVLAELELPARHLAAALFGFNAGVEVGQLAVVACVWPCLRALARPAGGRVLALVAEAGSAAICGLGIFWFLTRTLA